MECEKISAKHISSKRVVSRIHKEHIQLNNKKKRLTKNINSHVCKENINITNEHIKTHSTAVIPSQNYNDIPFHTH